MIAISLAEEDINVTVLDKVSEDPRTGSSFKIDNDTFDTSRTVKFLSKLASNGKTIVQLWSSIEGRLRQEVENNP